MNSSVPHNLKYDKDFIPCIVEEGDEVFRNGIFEFNISKMIEYLESGESLIEIEQVEVGDFHREFSSINESHVDSVDTSLPVILAEIAPRKFNLIDGNHRIEKAKRNGIQKLACYRLSVEQHLSFLTSTSAYSDYVEYWNEKVRQ